MHIQSLQWVIDLTGDGYLGLGEIWETLRWAFRLPGSLVVEFIGHYPAIAEPLGINASPETGYASLNGLLAKAISLLFWVPLFITTLHIGSKPKRRHSYADEHPTTQPLLLPMPKDQHFFVRH